MPGGWTTKLLLVVGGLSLLSFATQVVRHGLQLQPPGLNSAERWFFVDREMGVPAWFSASLLLLAGERLWRVATAARERGEPWVRHWKLLAVAFVYLSLDELTEIHEQVITPVREVFDLSGALAFAWVVVAAPLVLVFGVVFLRFLVSLPTWTRWAFVISAICYVGGALGVEMIGAVLAERSGVISTTTTVVDGVSTVTENLTIPTLTYGFVVGVEEALEMVGSVLFLGAVTVALLQRTARGSQAEPPERSSEDGDRDGMLAA
ncbi:hypothetical protein GCM10009616_29070 [Microlunatus lacustris]